MVAATVGLSLAFFLIALRSALKAARRQVVTGAQSLSHATGEVRRWAGAEGLIHTQGEDWQARSPAPLVAGQKVRVTGRDGLTLIVEPVLDTEPPAA